MQHQRPALLYGAVLLAMLACAEPSHAADRLTGQEVRDLFPGSFNVIAMGVVKVSLHARSNGTLLAQRGEETDSGSWRVRADKLCIKFRKWLNGDSFCSFVTVDDGWYRVAAVMFQRIGGEKALASR
jgi:hypothetical protein